MIRYFRFALSNASTSKRRISKSGEDMPSFGSPVQDHVQKTY
jgi:hypothetical protein